MQQVSMTLNYFSPFIEVNNNEIGESKQLLNVHNHQSPVNLMGERSPSLRTDRYFTLQHVPQISQQLFTSQVDQVQLQQQYAIHFNDVSSQVQTPASHVEETFRFYESFNQDYFSADNLQLPAAISDYNRNVMSYSQPMNGFVYLNPHVKPEQQGRQITQQMEIPPASHHPSETEKSNDCLTANYMNENSWPHLPVTSPSTEVKKSPKTSSPTFKLFEKKYFSNPGPIRASPPAIIFDETSGKELLVFSYSYKSIVTKFFLHCPQIDFSAPIDLDEEFLRDNCIYPKAMCSPEEYSGKRGNYERECNIIGWKLAEINPEIRKRRGLIQRAVDSWRNTREDIKIRSRRVRKEHMVKKRKQMRYV